MQSALWSGLRLLTLLKILESCWKLCGEWTVIQWQRESIKCIRKLHLDKPAAIIELKWNKNASGAIAQIKRQQYSEVLKDYHGDLLLASINYDKKTKLHECVIEKFQKY